MKIVLAKNTLKESWSYFSFLFVKCRFEQAQRFCFGEVLFRIGQYVFGHCWLFDSLTLFKYCSKIIGGYKRWTNPMIVDCSRYYLFFNLRYFICWRRYYSVILPLSHNQKGRIAYFRKIWGNYMILCVKSMIRSFQKGR